MQQADQLDATITIYWYSNQLNMFRAIFLPILRSARLRFTACGIMHPSCCWPVAWNAEALTVCSVWRTLPILRSARMHFTACGIMHPSCCWQHPSYRTHSQRLCVPGHRPATTWVHYTTSCKTQSSAPEDGQKIARNMLSWLEYQ